jgi:hypothetical protein
VASYYVYSGAGGSNNGTSWANAYTTLSAAFSGKAAGDVFYVAHDHAEAVAGTTTLTGPGTVANPIKIICASRSGSVPPVSADRRATAQVTTTVNNQIIINGFAHYDGIIFITGNSTGTASLSLINASGSGHWLRMDNCSLRIGSTGNGQILIGGGGGTANGYVELNSTSMSFSGTGQSVECGGRLRWRNSTLIGSAMPTNLIWPRSAYGLDVECIGVDLSAAGSGKTIAPASGTSGPAIYRFIDCKLNASVTKSATPSNHGSTEVDYIRSGSSGVNYTVHRHRISGLLIEETTIVRTGGASDGTTPIAWKVVTTANCTYSMPFECPPIAIWNDTTGSAKTATVECIGAAIATDQEVWLDVEYLGDASSPQGSFVNDGNADLLATAANQTSSSETWGGSTAAFKLAVTFTAQQKGWVYARVKCAKASSTFYVDPLVTLS